MQSRAIVCDDWQVLTDSELALGHEYGSYTELAEKLQLCADMVEAARVMDTR